MVLQSGLDDITVLFLEGGHDSLTVYVLEADQVALVDFGEGDLVEGDRDLR